MNNFCFIGVVYNNYSDTLDFLRSIALQDVGVVGIRCILVDNSDVDEIKKIVDGFALEFTFLTVVRPKKNLGYFGAFNYVFDANMIKQSEVVILCNNDLIFSSNFLRTYLSAKYPFDVDVVCPDVITVDGVHQNPHVQKRYNFMQRLKLDLYFSHYYFAVLLKCIQRILYTLKKPSRKLESSPSGYLLMGIGAIYILQSSFLAKFKSLHFPHFLYGEEAYLSKQVHDGGGRLYFDSSLKVLHKESATLSKLPGRVTYNFGRAGYWFYRKFY